MTFLYHSTTSQPMQYLTGRDSHASPLSNPTKSSSVKCADISNLCFIDMFLSTESEMKQ